jgi:4-diphosphocytidyl-2-C-methyl-D-erythritol kinase
VPGFPAEESSRKERKGNRYGNAKEISLCAFAKNFAPFAFWVLNLKLYSSMPGKTLTLPAFAKINWTLRVLGKRPDGYHEIRTLLQTISLHDTLSFTATDTSHLVLSCDERMISAGAENLVCRAAAALQKQFAPQKGAYIRLEKRIPSQAGLGGGSADAGVTLLALAKLWDTGATDDELREIAATLGADVPFFLMGGTALATGTGKDLTAVADGPDSFLLVIKPKAAMSTTEAYEALNSPSLTSAEAKTILSSSQETEFFDNRNPNGLQNDFEGVAFGCAPEIERARAALYKAGARAALLAGSGSAVFGVFDNKNGQVRAMQVAELEPGWRVFPCRTVGRSHYRSAMGPAA